MIFDAAMQCRLQFGSDAAVCAEPAELCEHLWCLVNNTCKTMLRPAAPGTECGQDMVRCHPDTNNMEQLHISVYGSHVDVRSGFYHAFTAVESLLIFIILYGTVVCYERCKVMNSIL